MRFLFLLLILFVLPMSVVLAQSGSLPRSGSVAARSISVQIRVADAKSQPVFGAAVYLRLRTDSTQTPAAITDTTGVAALSLRPNALYELRITALGMKPLTTGIRPTATQTTFRYVLNSETTALSAVTVTARKPLMRQEDDKTIIDPEPIANSSTNTYELLQKTPGLFLDQDGNVYLNGSSPATIYINGREQKMAASDVATILKSLPPNSVDRIELMRTPSARYDAATTGGAVNIILKKGVKIGRTGSITASMNQGRFGNQGVGLNLNNSDGNRSTYLNLNYNRRNTYDILTTGRALTNNQRISQEAYTQTPGDALFAGYGLGYQLPRRWELNLDGRANYGFANSFAGNSTQIRATADASRLLTSNLNTLQNLGKNGSVTQGISLRHKLDTLGSELVFDGSFNYLGNRINQTYATQYQLPANPTLTGDGTATTGRYFLTAQADWIRKRPRKLTLEAGLKTTTQHFDSRAEYSIGSGNARQPDRARTNTFAYTEAIHSGYVQASKTVGVFTLKAGLRAENTNMVGQQRVPTDTTFAVHRTDLFPYIYLSRPVVSIAGFAIRASLIYRRSITRPTYDQLNPFARYIDQYLYETGNPALQPQFTQNMEANLSVGNIPILAIGQNNTRQLFSSVLYQNPDNPSVAYRTTDNVGQNRETYFRMILGIPPGGRYFFAVVGQYSHTQYEGFYEGRPLTFSRGSWMLLTYHQVEIDKRSLLQLDAFYSINGQRQFYELGNFGNLNLSLNRKFLGQKLTVTASLSDVFYTNQNTFALNQGNIMAEGFRRADTRRVGLNLRYNLGFKKQRDDTVNPFSFDGLDRK